MRYYSAQFCNSKKGCTDCGFFSTKQKEVDSFCEIYAKRHLVSTRTHKKPNGFVPTNNIVITLGNSDMPFSISNQIKESRKDKK